MPGPLDGVRVLELGQIIAGPYAATALADLGAEVVKLEPPGGEGGRRLGQFAPGESKAFHTLSRGKRGIVVDLRMSRGREVVHRLIADFDVFVTNARPGVPERIGGRLRDVAALPAGPDLPAHHGLRRPQAGAPWGRSTRSGCRRSRSARART